MSNDLISRQAALKALEFTWAGKAAFDAIKELPSAQPEQRWIPCSERLPDVSGRCFVVNIAYYSEPISWQVSKDVIAWLPFPEPWKGGE